MLNHQDITGTLLEPQWANWSVEEAMNTGLDDILQQFQSGGTDARIQFVDSNTIVLDIFHQKLTQLAIIVGLEHPIESETNKEAV